MKKTILILTLLISSTTFAGPSRTDNDPGDSLDARRSREARERKERDLKEQRELQERTTSKLKELEATAITQLANTFSGELSDEEAINNINSVDLNNTIQGKTGPFRDSLALSVKKAIELDKENRENKLIDLELKSLRN